MARVKRGDRVVIADREATAADRKSGLFYPHLRGLRGVVDQVYDAEGEVCVEVDLDSLPLPLRRRHEAIQERARQRWLDGLSDQERRGLSDEQKQLRMKYTVMVAPEDLAPEPRARGRRTTEGQAPSAETRPVPAPSSAAAPGGRGAARSGTSAEKAPSGQSPRARAPAGDEAPTEGRSGGKSRAPGAPATPPKEGGGAPGKASGAPTRGSARKPPEAAGGRRLTEAELQAAEESHLAALLRRTRKVEGE